jgi:hypothetical protein
MILIKLIVDLFWFLAILCVVTITPIIVIIFELKELSDSNKKLNLTEIKRILKSSIGI